MFSNEGRKSLIKEVLKEDIFLNMTDEECLENISLIRKYLDELKAEYAFRVHMENGLESYDDIYEIIKDFTQTYALAINYKKILKKKGNYDNLNVKDLNENEVNTEKYFLNIPKKTIMIPKKKTR